MAYKDYKDAMRYHALFEVILWMTSPILASREDCMDCLTLLSEKIDKRGLVRVVQNIKSGSIYEVYRFENKLIGKGRATASGGKTLTGLGDEKITLNSRISSRGFQFNLDILGTRELRALWDKRTTKLNA